MFDIYICYTLTQDVLLWKPFIDVHVVGQVSNGPFFPFPQHDLLELPERFNECLDIAFLQVRHLYIRSKTEVDCPVGCTVEECFEFLHRTANIIIMKILKMAQN